MESLDQIWHDYHSGLLGFIRRRVGAAELLLFEFKTGPVDAQEGKPKTHDHPR